jgi:hypothetical protein
MVRLSCASSINVEPDPATVIEIAPDRRSDPIAVCSNVDAADVAGDPSVIA